MKEELLCLLTAKDVFNKYGIKINRDMCHCPFHKDTSPSMKVYKKSFYCFSCNRTGDFIEFVKQYFNLNFQEAMEKINFDFNLGLKTRGRMNKQRLMQLQYEMNKKRQEEEARKQLLNQKLIKACNRYRIYENILFNIKSEITPQNWEEKVEVVAFLQDKLELLDWYMEDLIEK